MSAGMFKQIKVSQSIAASGCIDQAADLLDLAGWGLDELFEASLEGPARTELLRELGLLET